MKRSKRRARFLGDIITSAVEGGTGYWAQVSQYQWVDRKGEVHVVTGERVGDEPRAVLHPLKDDESGYEPEGEVLTLDRVAFGLRTLLGHRFGVRADLKAIIDYANHKDDAGDIDADAADVIVQAALFEEIVYG
jgi:hypothetical protein